MKFKIKKWRVRDRFYIWCNKGRGSDHILCDILGLKYFEFVGIIKQHNALWDGSGEHYFPTQEDAESALEMLEPHIVMAKLIGD